MLVGFGVTLKEVLTDFEGILLDCKCVFKWLTKVVIFCNFFFY